MPPRSTTPSRTFGERNVPLAQQVNFTPNYAAIGSDGTLYVTEFNIFATPDPLAGLYIYPPTGQEPVPVITGAENPQGVDVDAVGNIYVVNNNLNNE